MVSGQIYQPSQHLQSSEMIKDYIFFSGKENNLYSQKE